MKYKILLMNIKTKMKKKSIKNLKIYVRKKIYK